MTNQEFFIALIHRLRNYDEALLLATMVAQRADESPERITTRVLSEVHFGGLIDFHQTHRAATRLEAKGLIVKRCLRNAWTEYHVQADALRALLATPIPETRFMPGVSTLPIPFLATLNNPESPAPESAAQSLATSDAGRPASVQPNTLEVS